MSFLLILSFVAYVSATCTCSGSTPVMSKSSITQKSSVCAGCQYPFYYSGGYNYLVVSYSYGQTISQNFYQNGQLVGSCNKSKTCNKRINIDPAYKVETVITRQTATNSYATHGTHSINFGRTLYADGVNTCNSFPEINIDLDEQTGFIGAGCNYSYYQSVENNFIIDMQFNDTTTVEIYENTTNTLIFSGMSNNFFENLNSTTGIIMINVTSDVFVSVQWMDVYPVNDDLNDFVPDTQSNIKTLAIVGIVFGVLSFTILISIISIVLYKRFVYNKNTYQQF